MNTSLVVDHHESKVIPYNYSPAISADMHKDVVNKAGSHVSGHHKIKDQIRLIEGLIAQHLHLARKNKSSVLNMMNQVSNEITFIISKCSMEKFPDTMKKTKKDLLNCKAYLGSEICISLEKVVPKIKNLLEEEGGMTEDEILINTDHIRTSVIDYTKSIMEMKVLSDIETHGNIAFDKKQRYNNVPAIFKTYRPEKTPKIPELQKFLDFINLVILKIELISKNGGEDLGEIVNLEAQ